MNVQTKEGSNQNIKSESKPQKKNAPPVFLGVTVETDQNYERNFNQLIQNGFGQAGEPKSLIQDLKSFPIKIIIMISYIINNVIRNMIRIKI